MSQIILKGRCLCGAVNYEVAGEAKRFYYCHCSRCRKATGTGHASNLFLQPATLKWLSGEEHIRAFKVPEPSGSQTSSAESAVAACHAKRRVPTPWFYPPDHWTTKHRLGRRRASSPIRAQAGPAPETSCRLIRDPHRNRYGPVQCGAVTHLVQPSCFGQELPLIDSR